MAEQETTEAPVFDPSKLTQVQAPTFDPSKLEAKKIAPPEEPQTSYLDRFSDIPADIGLEATKGVKALAEAPSKIGNTAENEFESYIPHWVGMGMSEEKAKGLAKKLQTRSGLLDLVTGPLQTLSSPFFGTLRSLVSRPIEENTGFPHEATELAAGIASGRPRLSRRPREVPSTERLRAESDTHYDVARALPIQYLPTVGPDIANNIERQLFAPRLAYREHTAPLTWKELEYLRSGMENYYPTVADIDAARTSLGRIAKQVDPNGHRTPDAGAAAHAIEFLDREMRRIQPNQVLSGAHLLPDLNRTLDSARGNYAAFMRSDIIEKQLDKAITGAATSGTGANVENKIRQAFGKIVHNPKLAQRYTENELALFREVAEGGTTRNTGRYVGRAAPSGPVTAATSYVINKMLGLPEGSAQALGWTSKQVADRTALRHAERAIETTRRRSPLYQSTPQNPRQLIMSRQWPMVGPLQNIRSGSDEEEELQ